VREEASIVVAILGTYDFRRQLFVRNLAVRDAAKKTSARGGVSRVAAYRTVNAPARAAALT
jgi:hypothetical protein